MILQSINKGYFLYHIMSVKLDKITRMELILNNKTPEIPEINCCEDRNEFVKTQLLKRLTQQPDKAFVIGCVCRPIRRYLKSDKSTKKSGNNFMIIGEDELSVFYLNKNRWEQATQLLVALASFESWTYIFEFAKKYDYAGPYMYIRNALTAPLLDNTNNYDSLENLGDVVLKVISSLHYFSKYEKKQEDYLTWRRTEKIRNDYLSKIAKSHGFEVYLRTRELKHPKLRPPHFEGPAGIGETDMVEQKISDGQIADMVESVIGGFFMGEGMLNSAKMVYRLDVLPESEENWEYTLQYFDNRIFTVLTPEMLHSDLLPENPNFSDIIPRYSDFHKCGDLFGSFEIVEELIGYKFINKDLLAEAFTHPSVESKSNYERLEFLGDAILDVVVVSNVFILSKYSADELTNFKHMTVNNLVLSKLSISLGLFRFMKSDKCTQDTIDKFVETANWDEDLINFGAYEDDPPKCLNDIFEALVGAVLIDSGSLHTACKIFGNVMKILLLHIGKNKAKCQGHIISRLSVYGQRSRKKIKYEETEDGDEYLVSVYADGEFIASHRATTRLVARQQAALKAYTIVSAETLICNSKISN